GGEPVLLAYRLVHADPMPPVSQRPGRRAELMAEDAAHDRDSRPATTKRGHDARGRDYIGVPVGLNVQPPLEGRHLDVQQGPCDRQLEAVAEGDEAGEERERR